MICFQLVQIYFKTNLLATNATIGVAQVVVIMVTGAVKVVVTMVTGAAKAVEIMEIMTAVIIGTVVTMVVETTAGTVKMVPKAEIGARKKATNGPAEVAAACQVFLAIVMELAVQLVAQSVAATAM